MYADFNIAVGIKDLLRYRLWTTPYLVYSHEKAVQEKYGLSQLVPPNRKTHDPRQKIEYGKTATTQAMSDTVRYIMDNYQYRSLPEFNAILRLYNLRAYDGLPGSKLRQFRGLIYQGTR